MALRVFLFVLFVSEIELYYRPPSSGNTKSPGELDGLLRREKSARKVEELQSASEKNGVAQSEANRKSALRKTIFEMLELALATEYFTSDPLPELVESVKAGVKQQEPDWAKASIRIAAEEIIADPFFSTRNKRAYRETVYADFYAAESHCKGIVWGTSVCCRFG